jgi:hypothetical protein
MNLSPHRVIGSYLLIALLMGCAKNNHSNTNPSAGSHNGTQTGTLTLSSTTIQKGQPLMASLSGGTTTSVKWSVSALSEFAHIAPAGNKAMILFAKGGTYRVTAAALGADSAVTDTSWAVVTVTDTVYQPVPSPYPDTTSFAGDQIAFTPQVDPSNNLFLFAQTGHSYGCSSSMIFRTQIGANGQGSVALSFLEVVSNGTGSCNGVENPASAYIFLGNTSQWVNGVYPFSVVLNGTTYTGTLTVSSTDYTFTWNYSSGILISPLEVKKK